MLHRLFTTFDAHPWIYWALALPAMAALLAWALAPQARNAPAFVRPPWLGAVVIGLTLLAWRWPWLLAATEFNPDESQIIAGAMALARDPVFWRSVDGTTSGPLNYYPLVPIAWLGLPLDFFTGRLAALAMVGGGCIALYRALAREADEPLARLGVIPVVLFFATTIDPDFVHYSSEHVSLLLAPVSLWLIARHRTTAGGGAWNLRFAAVAAGAIPWAKLQGVPLALLLLLWIAWLAWSSARGLSARLAAFAAVTLAGLLPSLILAAVAASGGVFDILLHRYVFQNATYVDVATEYPLALPGLLRRAAEFGQFIALGATALVLCVLAASALAARRRRPTGLLGIAVIWVAAALFAIAVPRREFLHYLLLAVMPLGLLGALSLAELWRILGAGGRRTVLALFLIGGVATPLAWRARQGPPFIIGDLLDHWRRPCHGDGAVLRALRQPGDELAIWGWSARTYIEARMPQATRDTHTFWATSEEPGHDPHRQVFLADFRARRPAFFLDATGEGAFFFSDRTQHGHETFPELADEIRRHYLPLIDLGYSRVYVRDDRFARQPASPEAVAALAARARPVALPAELPKLTTVGDARLEMLDGRNVLVLPAPARAYFLLEPTARALDLRLRFHPRALAARTSDGVEVVLQLVDTRGEREIYREHIPCGPDAHLDRRVVLPPFAPGTHLQIRALPGPHNDNAWDWLCVENLQQVRRSLFLAAQLPRFARLPSSAEFDTAALVGDAAAPVLRATAPGRVDFPLSPGDRQFLATLRSSAPPTTEVEIARVDAEGRSSIIAHHRLASAPDADGPTQITVALPAPAPGDRLRMTLSGASPASSVDFLQIGFR